MKGIHIIVTDPKWRLMSKEGPHIDNVCNAVFERHPNASAIYSEQRMSSPSDQCMTRDVATPVSNKHRFAVAPHTEAALNCFGWKLIPSVWPRQWTCTIDPSVGADNFSLQKRQGMFHWKMLSVLLIMISIVSAQDDYGSGNIKWIFNALQSHTRSLEIIKRNSYSHPDLYIYHI